jgi:hypothetical protein
MNLWITIDIVIIKYIGIAIGRWPLIKSNRVTIALATASSIGSVANLIVAEIAHRDYQYCFGDLEIDAPVIVAKSQ